MSHAARILSVLFAALGGSISAVFAAPAPETPVIAQDLVKARDAGDALAALWTRREDSFTLQIVLQSPLATVLQKQAQTMTVSRIVAAPAMQARAAADPKVAETQVWLLAEDGSIILPTRPADRAQPAALNLRALSQATEVTYRFPLSAGDQAVAAVMRIGDKFHVERLTSMDGKQK